MTVPFLDLRAQYLSIKDEIDRAIQSVVEACAFAGGPFVENFEKEFATYCGSRHCVGVGSGTEALRLILESLGVGEGDEVITVPNTFIATVEAVSLCGAKPVLVDVDDRFYTMDPERLRSAISGFTRAIIPVHLYGQPADLNPILDIAKEHGVAVVEDACQAHGALYRNRRAGSVGVAAAFSFYPGKNLGAYGEAGAVTTDDGALAERVRMLREHGQSRKYYHDLVGTNGRMDGIQGAVLTVKLRHLDAWNDARIRHAAMYDELLRRVEGVVPVARAPYGRHVYHIYGVHVTDRDRVQAALREEGIGSGIHYPVPIHLQRAYSSMRLGPGSFPVSERSAEQMLSLPMYPELSDEQIDHVSECLGRTLGSVS